MKDEHPKALDRFEIVYHDGDIIFCEYEPGDFFYFIKSGQVKLVKQNDNVESILDVLNAGVFFGEMAIIESGSRSATAISVGDVTLMRFSRENFQPVILQNSHLVIRLIQTFVFRIWSQRQRLQIYSFKDSVPRVLACMVNLKTIIKNEASGEKRVVVNASTEDIAKWVGISVNECGKVLHTLSSSEMIFLREKTIIILDELALEKQLAVYSRMKEKD